MTQPRSSSRNPQPEITKVTFNLPTKDVQHLKKLAERRHTTVTQVLREALGTEFFLADNASEEMKVLMEKGGETQRLVRKW